MKTITTLLIASATAISLNVSADNYLNGSSEDEYKYNEFNSFPTVTQTNNSAVFSILSEAEYQYVDPKTEQNLANVLNDMRSNPPAAGSSISENHFLGISAEDEYKHY